MRTSVKEGAKWDGRECNVTERSSVGCWISNTHSETHTPNIQTWLISKQLKKYNLHEKTRGKGLHNTAKRHRSHLIIHMATGVADDPCVPCDSLKRNLLKEWKGFAFHLWKNPSMPMQQLLKHFLLINRNHWSWGEVLEDWFQSFLKSEIPTEPYLTMVHLHHPPCSKCV